MKNRQLTRGNIGPMEQSCEEINQKLRNYHVNYDFDTSPS